MEELEACQKELEACWQELNEAKTRLDNCQNYYSDIDILVEALRKLPDTLYNYLEDTYGNAGVTSIEIEDAIEDILSIYGVDLEGGLKRGRRSRRVKKQVGGEQGDVPRSDVESDLLQCRNLLEECRENVELARMDADECERRLAEEDELAEEIFTELPDLLAEEIGRLINEGESFVSVSRDDIERMAGFIEEALKEHYTSKLRELGY